MEVSATHALTKSKKKLFTRPLRSQEVRKKEEPQSLSESTTMSASNVLFRSWLWNYCRIRDIIEETVLLQTHHLICKDDNSICIGL